MLHEVWFPSNILSNKYVRPTNVGQPTAVWFFWSSAFPGEHINILCRIWISTSQFTICKLNMNFCELIFYFRKYVFEWLYWLTHKKRFFLSMCFRRQTCSTCMFVHKTVYNALQFNQYCISNFGSTLILTFDYEYMTISSSDERWLQLYHVNTR